MKRKAPFFVLLLVSFLAIGFSCWKFIRIKKVECRLDEAECPPKLLGETRGYFAGEGMVSFSSREAEEKLLKNHFDFFSVKVRKKLPATLYINILRRKPVAILLPERRNEVAADEISQQIVNGSAVLADKEGVFLDIDRLIQGLPAIISPEGMVFSGRKVGDEAIIKVLDLSENMLFRSLMPVSMVIVTRREVRVRLGSGQLAVFTTEKGIIEQLDSLQYILGRAKIEGRAIRKIDLRFAKPVIL